MIKPHLIDINELPEDLHRPVLKWFAETKLQDKALSYREAAETFGYEYGTIRVYVIRRILKSVHTPQGPRILASEMARMISAKRKAGRLKNIDKKNAQRLQQHEQHEENDQGAADQ